MNRNMFITRSLIFYPGFFEDNCHELSDEVILPSHTLNRLMEQFNDGEMLYLNMTNTQTNQSCLVAIGSPHTYDKNTIYAPQWILEQIGCTGNCDSVIQITKADINEVPAATKIVIKPLDPIAFELDTLACFEKAFMNLHSIKEGITVAISVPELGDDYMLYAYIEKVEPTSVSRIVQGEVDVEFINEFKEIPIKSTPCGSSPLLFPVNPCISPPTTMMTATNAITSETPTATSATTIVQELTTEERRQQIRDSWVKRFQNNESTQ